MVLVALSSNPLIPRSLNAQSMDCPKNPQQIEILGLLLLGKKVNLNSDLDQTRELQSSGEQVFLFSCRLILVRFTSA